MSQDVQLNFQQGQITGREVRTHTRASNSSANGPALKCMQNPCLVVTPRPDDIYTINALPFTSRLLICRKLRVLSYLDSESKRQLQSDRGPWSAFKSSLFVVAVLQSDIDSSVGAVCRKLGVLSYLVHILASGEESGLVAAAVWALLQLAAEDPTNQKVVLGKANPAYLLE